MKRKGNKTVVIDAQSLWVDMDDTNKPSETQRLPMTRIYTCSASGCAHKVQLDDTQKATPDTTLCEYHKRIMPPGWYTKG